jgi:hypothetical protein
LRHAGTDSRSTHGRIFSPRSALGRRAGIARPDATSYQQSASLTHGITPGAADPLDAAAAGRSLALRQPMSSGPPAHPWKHEIRREPQRRKQPRPASPGAQSASHERLSSSQHAVQRSSPSVDETVGAAGVVVVAAEDGAADDDDADDAGALDSPAVAIGAIAVAGAIAAIGVDAGPSRVRPHAPTTRSATSGAKASGVDDRIDGQSRARRAPALELPRA